MPKFLIAAIPLTLLLSACDSEPVTDLEEERMAEAEAIDAPDDEATPERAHEGRRGHHGPDALLQKLCKKVECTDEQLVLLGELIASQPTPERGDHEARRTANAALATAFRGDGFGRSDLEAYRAAQGPEAAHTERMAALAVGVHGILDASQRAALGEKIAARGPFFLGERGGKHHRGGKHGKQHRRGGEEAAAGDPPREWSPEAHAERKAEKLCEALACTEEQRPQVAAALGRLPAPHEPSREADEALGQAFASDSFSAADVSRYLAAHDGERQAHEEAFATLAIELHGLLSPEQRATVAEGIERHGLHAMMGKRGGEHRRGGKHGKRRRHRRPAEEGAPQGDERGFG